MTPTPFRWQIRRHTMSDLFEIRRLGLGRVIDQVHRRAHTPQMGFKRAASLLASGGTRTGQVTVSAAAGIRQVPKTYLTDWLSLRLHSILESSFGTVHRRSISNYTIACSLRARNNFLFQKHIQVVMDEHIRCEAPSELIHPAS